MPTQFLQIEATTFCNFSCHYCFGRTVRQQHVDVDIVDRVLEDFSQTTHVEIQGEGEPLLHPQFFDIASQCRSSGIAVSSVTNGSLITPQIAAKFVHFRFSKIYVSIDTVDQNMSKEIGRTNLGAVIKGLHTIVKIRQEMKSDWPVIGLAVTVLRSTLGSIDSIVDLYEELGLTGGIGIQFLQQMSAYADVYSEAVRGQIPEATEQEQFRSAALSNPKLMRALQQANQSKGFYEQLFAGWKPATWTCPWLEKGLYVTAGGFVTPCPAVKDHERYGFGRVGIQSRAEIEAAREKMKLTFLQRHIPIQCQGCPVAEAMAGLNRRTADERAKLVELESSREDLCST